MTVTTASLRTSFPAFASATDYPDPQVQFWITWAGNLFDPGRWGSLLDLGVMLWVCHNLSLEFMAQQEAAVGNQPGVVRGTLASGSVDKASFGYNSNAVTLDGAGDLNLTIYGIRYLKMVKQVGAGPVYVAPDGCSDPTQSLGNGSGAWPGPFIGY